MAMLQFKGKAFVQNHHLTVKHHELVPCKAKSLTGRLSLRDDGVIFVSIDDNEVRLGGKSGGLQRFLGNVQSPSARDFLAWPFGEVHA